MNVDVARGGDPGPVVQRVAAVRELGSMEGAVSDILAEMPPDLLRAARKVRLDYHKLRVLVEWGQCSDVDIKAARKRASDAYGRVWVVWRDHRVVLPTSGPGVVR